MSVPLARRRAAGEPMRTRHGDRITVATWVAAGAAVLGMIGVVVFGGLWWLAGHGSDARVAAERDDALMAARQIAVNLQTLDSATAEAGLRVWESSATGPLLAELRKNHQQYAEAIRKVRTSSTAQVMDAALADLDVATGKARAIASVDVKTTQNVNGLPSLPVTRQVRIALELVRVPDIGWKAAAASAIQS